MEQVEGQVYLTAKEVTHLLDQVTQSSADDLLADSMKMNEYSKQLLLPTQTYATIGCGIRHDLERPRNSGKNSLPLLAR